MKKINMLIATVMVTVGLLSIGACGGGNKQVTENDEASVESQAPESSATVEAVSDPDAKSDSKGVGKFTSVDVSPNIDEAMAKRGKLIFETKCTPCHKTTDEKLVGPGLKNITNLRTPEWIMNMITNPEEMTKQDPVAKALFEKHLIQMTFQNVSDTETREIYEYLRENDKK